MYGMSHTVKFAAACGEPSSGVQKSWRTADWKKMRFLTDAIALRLEKESVPPSFQPLANFALTILVGLTGVGKTTIVQLLQDELDFTLLPNRREITDEVIIGALQQEEGKAPYLVTDRIERFEYTARYRAQHPGGMAHALDQLIVDAKRVGQKLVFDGLRGLDEVEGAANRFPRARFVVLDAPDLVRIRRLLKRADAFDSTKIQTSLAGRNLIAGLYSVPNIEAVFNQEEMQQIARSARAAGYSVDDVVKKSSIIVEERRNYDSSAARVFLRHRLPPDQVLVVDTSVQSAQAVADQVKSWLKEDPSRTG
jgi:guanylate kinase